MNKRRFIKTAAGLLVPASLMATVPLPTGFFKPASGSSSVELLTTNLIAQWEADGITGLNDGDAVTNWTDQSGQSRTASQATAGLKPLYKTNIFGSKPAVRFDGVDDYLTFTPVSIPDFTVFLAWSAGGGTAGPGGTYWGPLSWRIWAGGGATGFIMPGGNGTPYQPAMDVLKNASEFHSKKWSTSSGTRGKALDAVRWNGTSTTLTARINGVVQSPLDAGPTGLGAAGPTGVASGIGSANYAYIAADFGGILVYSAALSDGDIVSVESYLNAKYSIY